MQRYIRSDLILQRLQSLKTIVLRERKAIWLIKWNLAIAPAIQQRCVRALHPIRNGIQKPTVRIQTKKWIKKSILYSIIEPYQHEPVEEDREEDASSEDSMSDEESNAYEERLNNINW